MISPERKLAVVAVAVLLGLALGRAVFAPTTEVTYVSRTEQIMATPITVRAPAAQIDRAADIAFAIFRDVDARMSEWKDSSPLSGVNRAAGVEPAPVPDDLRALIRRGVEIGEQTAGAFDITWAALWGLWDFKSQSPSPPPREEIDARLPLIDYRLVQIDDDRGTVYLPRPGMLIGLGGIAKGHALDRAAAALREAGIESFLISAGGQVLVGGPRQGPGGGRWRIGIRDPRGCESDFFARIELADTCIATSGDYERYFILDGVRYHHVLDPRTGRPSRHVRSVAVISPDATLADALSTALMVMERDSGMALVEQLAGVEALLIDAHGEVHLSSGFPDLLPRSKPVAKADL